MREETKQRLALLDVRMRELGINLRGVTWSENVRNIPINDVANGFANLIEKYLNGDWEVSTFSDIHLLDDEVLDVDFQEPYKSKYSEEDD